MRCGYAVIPTRVRQQASKGCTNQPLTMHSPAGCHVPCDWLRY